MENFKTDQESFWAREFGSDYIDRNKSAQLMYILIGEYYNPTPVAINYRGHEDRLF